MPLQYRLTLLHIQSKQWRRYFCKAALISRVLKEKVFFFISTTSIKIVSNIHPHDISVHCRLSSSQAERLSAHSDRYLCVGSWRDAASSAVPARVNGQRHPWHLCPLWDATIDSAPGHLESQVLHPDEPGLSCRKPRVTVDARSLANTSQVTLKLISSTTTLYGPIHLNQSCY